MNTEIIFNTLLNNLKAIFHAHAERLNKELPNCKFEIDNYSTNYFLLYMYISILKNSQSDEVAISVSMTNTKNAIVIDSDINGPEGKIVSEGPMLELTESLNEDSIDIKIDFWLEQFKHFLNETFNDTVAEVKNLE